MPTPLSISELVDKFGRRFRDSNGVCQHQHPKPCVRTRRTCRISPKGCNYSRKTKTEHITPFGVQGLPVFEFYNHATPSAKKTADRSALMLSRNVAHLRNSIASIASSGSP